MSDPRLPSPVIDRKILRIKLTELSKQFFAPLYDELKKRDYAVTEVEVSKPFGVECTIVSGEAQVLVGFAILPRADRSGWEGHVMTDVPPDKSRKKRTLGLIQDAENLLHARVSADLQTILAVQPFVKAAKWMPLQRWCETGRFEEV